MEMEVAQRNELLQMDSRQMYVLNTFSDASVLIALCRRDVTAFVNSYPTLDVTSSSRESILPAHRSHYESRSAVMRMKKKMKCDISVVAPYFPGKKMANWWVVVGAQSTRQLLSIKRVTISKRSAVSASYVKTSPCPHLPGLHTDAVACSGFRSKRMGTMWSHLVVC